MSQTTIGAQIILFTSCKGGVGKSTVCANLAMTMATLGKRVLMIDCDLGNRCLDIIAGFSNEALYDIGDVLARRVPYLRAVVTDKRCKNLHFLAAPYEFGSGIPVASFRAAVNFYAGCGEFDFIFIDTPGGVGESMALATSVADTAYIIVAPTRAAIRAADRTASFLALRGVRRQRLIVNEVVGKNIDAAKENIIDIIDESRVRLIGAVPYETELIRAGDEGILTDELLSENVTRAFDNIARRTLGINVPLFYKIKKIRRMR